MLCNHSNSLANCFFWMLSVGHLGSTQPLVRDGLIFIEHRILQLVDSVVTGSSDVTPEHCALVRELGRHYELCQVTCHTPGGGKT